MPWNLEQYLSSFSGGARQYLFMALFDTPGGYGDKDKSYLVRSTNLPDSSFEEINVLFPGHVFKMAGTRMYGDWTVSFNVDANASIINSFNYWHNMIYDPRSQTASTPKMYMRDQYLDLLDGVTTSDGSMTTIKRYKLKNAWPKLINQVSLDYASTDIAVLDITFAYQYYEIIV